jgi:hypothetical protein
MTLQPIPSEFSYIREKFYIIFYHCRINLRVAQTRIHQIKARARAKARQ